MHGVGKSDKFIVPRKAANEGRPRGNPEEPLEGRDLAKGKPGEQNRTRTQGRERLSQALDRLRKVAKERKEERFTAIWHHVYDRDRLRGAYWALKREAAPGVDGETWRSYGKDLEANLEDLSGRLKRGSYRARAVKRGYIPKADGRSRPIGVPVLEDKIVQRAAAEVLGAIYEEDFLGCSYGFRRGRSQHDALDAAAVAIERRKVNWIYDADIRSFFDSMDHEWVLKFVEHRIADRRVRRHIAKWLNAGVLEDGQWRKEEQGVPQGGSISPLLANLYLHYALDLWVQSWRRRCARGEVIYVRYADDFIVGFQYREDALRFQEALRGRLGKFSLELSEEKTRLIEFGRYAAENRARRGEGKPRTFNFLGFTHICGKTRAGKFCVLRRTMAKKTRAKMAELTGKLRKRLHQGIAPVGKWLNAVLRGHYLYYGVPRNLEAMRQFRHRVIRLWRRMLLRRGQKNRHITWAYMTRLADRWLPKPRIVHPYPGQRLAV